MLFLLDANVEHRLAAFLTSLGHDVKTIARDYPASLADHDVLNHAVAEKRILITNDRDYGELIFRQHFSHCGVIFFRLKNSKDISGKLTWLTIILQTYKDNLRAFAISPAQESGADWAVERRKQLLPCDPHSFLSSAQLAPLSFNKPATPGCSEPSGLTLAWMRHE